MADIKYKDRTVSVRIDKGLYQLLKKRKEKTGVSIVFMIETAIKEYLEKREG